MKPRLEESSEFEELPLAEPEAASEPPRPAIGYRIAGDIEVRSKDLEQELVELRSRYEKQERELWAARRSARTSRALATATRAASRGGTGATVAGILATVLYVADIVASPPALFGMVIAAYILGALSVMGSKSDDDGFPPAPPERLR